MVEDRFKTGFEPTYKEWKLPPFLSKLSLFGQVLSLPTRNGNAVRSEPGGETVGPVLSLPTRNGNSLRRLKDIGLLAWF